MSTPIDSVQVSRPQDELELSGLMDGAQASTLIDGVELSRPNESITCDEDYTRLTALGIGYESVRYSRIRQNVANDRQSEYFENQVMNKCHTAMSLYL